MRRIGYRSGIKGAGSLFPRDAVLGLPPCGYSWALQRLAEMFCRSGSYEQAHEWVLAVTGVSVGRRQLEQIVVAAAADAERFCQDRAAPSRGRAPRRDRAGGGRGPAAAGDVGGRQGRGDAPGGAPPHRQGPGQAGADLRETGRDRGEERLQADGRDRVRLRRHRRRTARRGRRSRSWAWLPPRPRRAPGGEPLVRLRYHRQPRRDHRDASTRPGAATPAMPGPGSPWSTGTTARSTCCAPRRARRTSRSRS